MVSILECRDLEFPNMVIPCDGCVIEVVIFRDEKKCTKQRQGLLQWGWDSTEKYTLEQRLSNLKKLGVSVDKKELEEWEEGGGKKKVTKESMVISPPWVKW